MMRLYARTPDIDDRSSLSCGGQRAALKSPLLNQCRLWQHRGEYSSSSQYIHALAAMSRWDIEIF